MMASPPRGHPPGVMLVNVALELYGTKQNLQFTIPNPCPALQQLRALVEEAFQAESATLKPADVHMHTVIVEEMELYDMALRRWVRLDHPSQVTDGCQLYAFQPSTVDDQGRIPPARPAPRLQPPPRSNSPGISPAKRTADPPPPPPQYPSEPSPARKWPPLYSSSPAVPTGTRDPTSIPPSRSVPGGTRSDRRGQGDVGWAPPDVDTLPVSHPQQPQPGVVPRHRTLSPYQQPAREPITSPSADRTDYNRTQSPHRRSEPSYDVDRSPKRKADKDASRPLSPPNPTTPPVVQPLVQPDKPPPDYPSSVVPRGHVDHHHHQQHMYVPESQSRHPQLRPPQRPDRVVVVIGCTRGIGEACVRWLVGKMKDPSSPYQYVVIGCGRNEQVLKEMKTEMPMVHFYAVDILDAEGVERFAGKVAQQHNAPNLVINTVAMASKPQPFLSLAKPDFDMIFDTTVKGIVNTARSFLRLMASAASLPGYEGVFVAMSSNWGRTAVDGHAAYSSAKWAVEGFCKCVALELPPNLACLPLNPGVVNTQGLQTLLGPQASESEPPKLWAERCMPFILSLSPKDTGRSLTCPGAPPHHYDNGLQTSRPLWSLGFQ